MADSRKQRQATLRHLMKTRLYSNFIEYAQRCEICSADRQIVVSFRKPDHFALQIQVTERRCCGAVV